jgi:nucleotidyltransferase substrate binding protein (TIGR01987 family)
MLDSAIQRFEFTFELAWKKVKTFCNDQTIEVYSPREVIKTAFQIGLIDESLMWLEMLKLRMSTGVA